MANKVRKNLVKDDRIEDVTMYGEVIPSLDNWITPDKQRKRVEHIEKETKSKK